MRYNIDERRRKRYEGFIYQSNWNLGTTPLPIFKEKQAYSNQCNANGSLKSYLYDINEQAEKMIFELVRQMAKDEGVDESLKRCDQLEWIQQMNSIRNRVEEIVLSNIIYF